MGRKLYVGNLNWNTTEDALRQAFAASGTVSEVAIILDRETGRPRGFAFVTMSSDEEARSTAETMDGAMLDGRPLRVNEAQDRRPGGEGGARPPRPPGGGFRSGPPRADFRGGMGAGTGGGGGPGELAGRPPREFRDQVPHGDPDSIGAGGGRSFSGGGGGGGGGDGEGGGRGGRGGPRQERGRGGKPGRSREDDWRGGGKRGGDGAWDEDFE